MTASLNSLRHRVRGTVAAAGVAKQRMASGSLMTCWVSGLKFKVLPRSSSNMKCPPMAEILFGNFTPKPQRATSNWWTP